MHETVAEIRSLAAREVVPSRPGRIAIAIGAFVVATALSAYVVVPVPWSPVPVTLQPLIVLLAGLLLGPRWGSAAMAAYVAVGAAGAPVFAGGGAGLPHLAGPTGGYLVAFPVAAAAAGLVAGSRSGGIVRASAGVVAGLLALYVGGVAQLAVVTGFGLERLLALGVAPFLAGDLVKAAIAVVLGGRLRKRTLELL